MGRSAILVSLPRALLVCVTLVHLQFDLARCRQIPNARFSLHTNRYNASEFLPIVIWHGMGDSADDPGSMGAIRRAIQDALPGVYVHSIALGDTPQADVWASFLGNVNDQISRACRELAGLPALANGYAGIGFSQGGQFLRGLQQRCGHVGPSARVLVTMGSQHQGVNDVPGCWQPSWNATPTFSCRVAQRLLEFGVYNPFVQRHVVQAQYYKAPDDLAIYYEASGFLADINAEAGAEGGRGPLPPMWKTYRNNLASLDRLVLFQFDNDITVVPKESAHFAFYDGHRLVPVQETSQYERLGLNELEKKGALIFEHAPGMHMAFTLKWFVDHVVRPYLAVRADQRAV